MQNFDLRSYLYNNPLLKEEQETEVVDDLKGSMSNLLKGLENELEKSTETQNEGLLTAASIALALPAVMGLVAKFGKSAGALVNKVLGKKPSQQDEYQKWMDKLGHIADELHHLYMVPLTAVVKKFIKDEAKAKKVANAVFHIIVATMLIASGVTAVKAFKAQNVSLGTLEAALTAIKGGEVKAFLSSLV
jgi:hypothetical protein